MSDRFKALLLTQENGKTAHQIRQLTVDDLPEGDVLAAVNYSSLNDKDCLAISGRGKIVRKFPIIPGGLLDEIFKVVSLEEVPQFAEHLLAGRVNGRVVVDVTL